MSCMGGYTHRADMKHYTASPHFSGRNIPVIQTGSVLSQDHQVNHQWTAETKLRNTTGETLGEQVIFWGIAIAAQAFLEVPSWNVCSFFSLMILRLRLIAESINCLGIWPWNCSMLHMMARFHQSAAVVCCHVFPSSCPLPHDIKFFKIPSAGHTSSRHHKVQGHFLFFGALFSHKSSWQKNHSRENLNSEVHSSAFLSH